MDNLYALLLIRCGLIVKTNHFLLQLQAKIQGETHEYRQVYLHNIYTSVQSRQKSAVLFGEGKCDALRKRDKSQG